MLHNDASPGGRYGDERGSLPVAMLASLIVTALVMTLVATTITGQHAARFDQNFTEVFHGADAGVEEALFRVNHGTLTETITPVAGVLGDSTYQWTARRLSATRWQIRSTGVQNGVDRVVTATLRDQSRFAVGAFADLDIEFRGSNRVDSYNSTTGDDSTGRGAIGTNGTITFHGNATADRVVLYDFDANPSAARCSGSFCSERVEEEPERLDLGSDARMAFIDDQLARCEQAAPLGAWVASEHNGVLSPGMNGPLCFESVVFDTDTTITGPVVAYVRGKIAITRGKTVNCTSPCATPDASRLQVYGAGRGGDEGPVLVGNQATFAGTIYAPRSACRGNPSNAQADLYGALYCQTIDNQGGWKFHWDEGLENLGVGRWQVERWTEE